MDTPDINQITNLASTQKAGTQGFLAGQNLQTSDYLKRYTDFLNGQEGASAMAKRIGDELGVPQLQSNALMLRNTLTNLPSTYSAATRGFDVNNNQLQRIIGQKSSELAPVVDTAERSLSSAQNNLTTRMGYEQTDQQKALIPFQTEGDFLKDRLARETTLYTSDNERELNALISKIQMGVTLSEGEKNRAQELAISERNYELEKQKINQPNTQVIEQGGQKLLIDSNTGKVINKYGSSTSSSAAKPTIYLGNNNGMQSIPTLQSRAGF